MPNRNFEVPCLLDPKIECPATICPVFPLSRGLFVNVMRVQKKTPAELRESMIADLKRPEVIKDRKSLVDSAVQNGNLQICAGYRKINL